MKKIGLKAFRYSLMLIFILVLPILQGCDLFNSKCSGDSHFLSDNSHSLRLYDYYSEEELLGINGQYSRDTVKIFDADGHIYFGGPVRTDGLISFQPLTLDDWGKVNQLEVRELYLYLNQYDTDTLRYEFEMRNTECGDQEYKYVKLTYNDSVYVDEFNRRFPYRELYKK